jgi:RNA polymerase sigma-70 factor (ECF subfamily)
MMIAEALAAELHRTARAERWDVSTAIFAAALSASAGKAFGGRAVSAREGERYLRGLHLEDLALACACAAGHERAWDHFIREYRPVLYRAADALDRSGGAREIADALYADLYGVRERDGDRLSLFRYFHGRSSLATWLRAVLAQRHVDRIRSDRRIEPLPDDEEPAAKTPAGLTAATPDPERARYVTLILRALRLGMDSLGPRDRLRFSCYYADQLTLAQTGRILGEHEATASRQLAGTRKALRALVERGLRQAAGLNDAQIARAFECAAEDAGSFDLSGWASRKEQPDVRSTDDGQRSDRSDKTEAGS